MANQDLVRYVNEQRSAGVPDDQIRGTLESVGWAKQDVADAVAEAGPTAAAPAPDGLAQELRFLRQQLNEISNRLSRLEGGVGGTASYSKPYASGAVSVQPVAAAQKPQTPKESVESKITGLWFAGVGVVALLFGVGFFLKYAFENGWIGETGRVAMGIAGGIILLAVGDVLSRREKYRRYSFFLSGGGLALLYLSTFAAFQYYHLISQAAAFVFLICVTIAGTVLGVKSESRVLTAMTLLGGFLTPFLVSTGVDNQAALMSYILLLDAGFLAVSYFKRWMSVYLITFLGTYAVFYSWYGAYYEEAKNLGPTILFLTLFHLVFLAAPFFRSVFRRMVSDNKEVVSTVINASFYFATAYMMLNAHYHDFMGFFFAAWAGIYLLLAIAVRRNNETDKTGIFSLAGAGLVLATLAVPIQLSAEWITVAWAIEALVLTWIGFQLKSRYIRAFADAVGIVTVLRLLFFGLGVPGRPEDFQPVLNERFFTWAIAIIVFFMISYLYRVRKDETDENERSMAAVFGIAANLLAVIAISNESVAYFDKRIDALTVSSAKQYPVNGGFAYSYGQDTEGISSLRNQKNLSLSIIWGLYSGLLMIAGILGRSRYARVLSMMGFAIVILKVFLVDSSSLSDLYRIISFMALGVILLVVSFLFYKYKEKIKQFILA